LATVLLLALVLTSTASTGEPAIVERTIRAPDGVSIAFDVRGRGETALVFIHCWACDRSFWRNQLDEFAATYRVVALDLAGHGASGKDRKRWSIAGLGGDVAALVNALHLRRVILIGHSMGGPVALEAAHQLRGAVVGVVLVDTLQDVAITPPRSTVDELVARFHNDFKGTMTGFVRGMFADGADPSVVAWTAARASTADQAAVLAILADFPNLSPEKLLAQAKIPIRAINAAPPRSPRTAVESNRRYADYDATVMNGVGHFMMLERPAEFNTQLRQTLASVAAQR
jgi:pimeloyl-ACP methyl ester carboxylesterase